MSETDTEQVRDAAPLVHTLWIGGAPATGCGAPATGKTTVATRIARRYGLRLYSSDTRTWVHRDHALRE